MKRFIFKFFEVAKTKGYVISTKPTEYAAQKISSMTESTLFSSYLTDSYEPFTSHKLPTVLLTPLSEKFHSNSEYKPLFQPNHVYSSLSNFGTIQYSNHTSPYKATSDIDPFSVVKRLFSSTTPTQSSDVKPKTLVGAETFRELVEQSNVYVDKTLLIKEFLESSYKVLLITFPRRFCKSLNMDTIRTFVEIEIDEKGKPKANTERSNPQLFEKGKLENGIVSPLKILSQKSLVDNEMGQYPVMSIDFKNIKGKDYKSQEEAARLEIKALYEKHKYLLKSERLTQEDKDKFNKYYLVENLTTEELKKSLLKLNQILHNHFGKNTIILIDEYDTPINSAYQLFTDTDITDSTALIKGLLGNLLKRSSTEENYVHKALVTGILRIAKADMFSDVNNFNEFNITDSTFAPYYGFIQHEVEYLLSSYKVSQNVGEQIKHWYNGYNIGNFEIYNPWSIIKCLAKLSGKKKISPVELQTEILQSYWEESGNISNIIKIFKSPSVRSKIEQLINNVPLNFTLYKAFTTANLDEIREFTTKGSNYKITEAGIDILLSYLFSTGYLTIDSESFRQGVYKYKLPNYEIRKEFEGKLLEFYKREYNIDPSLFLNVTDHLQIIMDSKDDLEYQEAINSFEDAFITLLAGFPKFVKIGDDNVNVQTVDKQVHANEDLIHSVMSYITLQLKSFSKYGTEVYLGQGIADIMITDEQNNKASIIEFKFNKKTASIGYEQIVNKKYAEELEKKFTTVKISLNVDMDKKVTVQHSVKNFKGNGTDDEGDNSYDLPYCDWFNEYYSEGIETILALRLKNLRSKIDGNIKILPAKYQLTSKSTDMDKVVHSITADDDIVLVPYNIENKHWVGLIFQKSGDEYKVRYIDPENKPIEPRLLSSLKEELCTIGQKFDLQQVKLEKQKYKNCGAEVVENFVYYLTGDRIKTDKAVIYHSKLLEKALLDLAPLNLSHYNTDTINSMISKDVAILESDQGSLITLIGLSLPTEIDEFE